MLKKENFTTSIILEFSQPRLDLHIDTSTRKRFNKFSRNESGIIVRRKACDGNEESHDLGSKRSAKFVCEETRDRNAASPFLRTRDHRIGKSSSAVSCNYGQSRSRAFLACIYTCIYVYSHRVSGNHHPSFFPLLYPPLGAPITLSLSHSRACRVGCVRIAFRCAFTGGWTISLCSG